MIARTLPLGAALFLAACGGTANDPTKRITGDGNDAGVVEGRVPKHHRSTDETCSEARAASTAAACNVPDPTFCACSSDADCNGGKNGRCLPVGPTALRRCSYDECSDDSSCSGAPCVCREAGSIAANACVPASNCRVDADCGPSGYCSPSVVNQLCACTSVAYCTPEELDTCGHSCSCGDSCGHGYFCHTREDQCLDDTDCPGGSSCNFDKATKAWTCSECMPVP